jgi:hypothetical protein
MRAGPAPSLARFQDAFARALVVDPAQAGPIMAPLVAQPAFAVYRNTVMKGCIDALEANFPAVARLVGAQWFRAAAAVFAAAEPPKEPSLLAYGESFPAFLAAFEPAAELPYLPDVARLDLSWTRAHVAADGPVLGREAFTSLDPGRLAEAVLHPHPAAHWAWFADAPIYTIWSRNRGDGDPEGDLDWRGEGALVTRPADAVRWTAIDAAGCRFLDACARGLPVAQALDAALEADPGANLVRLTRALVGAGAFGRLGLATEID